jgi:hypothetical protein
MSVPTIGPAPMARAEIAAAIEDQVLVTLLDIRDMLSQVLTRLDPGALEAVLPVHATAVDTLEANEGVADARNLTEP